MCSDPQCHHNSPLAIWRCREESAAMARIQAHATMMFSDRSGVAMLGSNFLGNSGARRWRSGLGSEESPGVVDVQRLTKTSPAPSWPAETQRATLRRSISPLSILPLATLIRSLAVSSITSSPVLLPFSLAVMARLADSTSPFFSLERNTWLRWIINRTIYAQFCAGATSSEIGQTVDKLKQIGFEGVILSYARETVMDHDEASGLQRHVNKAKPTSAEMKQIEQWKHGTLDTVRLAGEDDFVAVKLSIPPFCPHRGY